MSRFNLFKLAGILLVLTSLNLYGQKKEITSKEYSDIFQRIERETNKLAFRLNTERAFFDPKGTNIRRTEKGFSENLPDGSLRIYREITDYDPNRTRVLESIKIASIQYQREDNKNWEITSEGPKAEKSEPEAENKYRKYYLTKNVRYGKKTVDILEFEEEFVSGETDPANGKVHETTIFQSQKWYSENGLWLRFELVKERLNPRAAVILSLSDYEYDPTIKIEKPIK
ncbi:MAG: hypothetical protein R2747_19345 [Pyrinomonadaceae bacterium]